MLVNDAIAESARLGRWVDVARDPIAVKRRMTLESALRRQMEPPSFPVPFSFLTDRIATPQVACHITETTQEGHALIRANLHRAPIWSSARS